MRWLMLELCGPWGHSALLESPSLLPPELGRQIAQRVQAADIRVAAIRRPGKRPDQRRWRWALADARPGQESLQWGEVHGPGGYAEIPLDGSAGTPTDEPLVAICAHGKHDQCCAVRGRRATSLIAERYPEATWECSHLGGDRFAATMIVLPHGLFYGRVDLAENPADIIDRYTQGQVEPRFLRGRSSYPAEVQVAQHHARAAFGDDRIDAFAPLGVIESDGQVEVTLAGPLRPVEVRLRETYSEPIFTMCQARSAGPVRQWELVKISGGG
ncbi:MULTISPECIES: sucrase ferredoxin [unclassified Dietzia]|uniref:sucrase ferredoxin n=1 Tax=unclassified Dietzia TaxID=2617939 RepID=UPI000D21C606|nr:MULTISPECIES: sucrase ferredoxin [unclassified Dietzia]AVZ41003.1 sucrase ferredoxin [Dietzia sp. JS16-p6b]